MGILFFNDKEVEFHENETILNVAKRAGIYIPALCFLEKVNPTGACRLCLVSIDGIAKPVTACTTYARENLRVYTDTPEVIRERNKALEFVLMKHPLDCPICDKGGYCLLQDITYELGINKESVKVEKPSKEIKNWNLIVYNPNLCVLCERCVKLCRTVVGENALKIVGAAFNSEIEPTKNNLMCDFCGLCVDFCPVGALLDKPFRHSKRVWDITYKRQLCVFCPIGCDIDYGVCENNIVKTKSVPNSALCGMGRYAFSYLYNKERLNKCMIKKDGNTELMDFSSAFIEISTKLKNIVKQYGKNSLAFLVGSRLSNESIIALKQLVEGLGTNKVITDISCFDRGFFNSYKKVFGTFNNIGLMEDIKDCDLIFVIGADLSRELIGLKWQVVNTVVKNEAKLINIGLKTYDFDYIADYSLLADYADFATIFNGIKHSENKSSIREMIHNAKNICVIIGMEFISYEKEYNCLFDFIDFLNIEKIKVLITSLNKGNFRGLLQSGLLDYNYFPEQCVKDLKTGNIKCLIGADFYPYSFLPLMEDIKKHIADVEYHISLDLFVNDFNKEAYAILPVLSPFEKNEHYTTLDGKVKNTNTIIEPIKGAYSDIFYIRKLAEIFNIDIDIKLESLCNEDMKAKTYNKCDYTYKKREEKPVDVYINDKYHNGLLTTFACYQNDESPYKKPYIENMSEDLSRYSFAKGLNVKIKPYK